MKRFLTAVMLITAVSLVAVPKTMCAVKTLQVAVDGEANSAAVVKPVLNDSAFNDRSRHISRGGGRVHSADSFGDLVFALE